MNKETVLVISALLLGMTPSLWALEEKHPGRRDVHSEMDHHGEIPGEMPGAGKVGPEQAVTAASPTEGFKLSETAAKTIGLALAPIPEGGSLLLAKEAIVRSQDETGIYRFRGGWLKFILGREVREGDRWRFTPLKGNDLKPGDQVAVEGVPLVRATDIYIFSAQEDEGE